VVQEEVPGGIRGESEKRDDVRTRAVFGGQTQPVTSDDRLTRLGVLRSLDFPVADDVTLTEVEGKANP
jgi:hypothetical protein